MKVTICGHSDVAHPEEVCRWLYETVERLIQLDADMFLLGGYGAFDRMAASVVWDLKQKYPQIQSVLVKPYLYREMDESKYDWTVYPGLETVPTRYAITHRNRYMVEEADLIPVLNSRHEIRALYGTIIHKSDIQNSCSE